MAGYRFTSEQARAAGKKAAANLTPTQRTIRAQQAGNTTLRRFGVGYYSSIADHRWANSKKTK